MREAMVEVWCEAADSGVDLVVVVADSTSTAKIAPFQERHPQRVVNVGIAEQTLVGVAAGLSMGGTVTFTANAAPFLVARANEQVKNDICYSENAVCMVGLNAGFAYSNLGSTHHAIDDISIMRGFGSVRILAPCDAVEAREMFRYALEYRGPLYIRMDSAALPLVHDATYRLRCGEPDILREGSDCTVCALGSVVHEACDAAAALHAEGVDVQVVNLSSIRPLSTGALLDCLCGHGPVVTVEEHGVCGGIGSLVAETIAESGCNVLLRRLGIPQGEFARFGPRDQVRQHHQLDAAGIGAAVRLVLGA